MAASLFRHASEGWHPKATSHSTARPVWTPAFAGVTTEFAAGLYRACTHSRFAKSVPITAGITLTKHFQGTGEEVFRAEVAGF